VEKATSLALAVPSVLVPQEHNFLLNRAHPEFSLLSREGPEDFPINPRLAPDATAPRTRLQAERV
jgi:RES domain-containing protein